MSRGLGSLQRDTLAALYAAEDNELPVRELRRRLGNADRSNLRRVVRGLLRRNYAEQLGEGVGSSVKLTFWGTLKAHFLLHRSDELPLPWRRRDGLAASLRSSG